MQAEVNKTVEVLKNGGVILYPTDTIWGIGCDASNPKAVNRIYKIKKRIEGKSLLILVDTPERIGDYVKNANQLALELITNYDKPLTAIFPGAINVAKGVAAGDNSIGIRVVKDEFCKMMIRKLGKAVVSTSANISGFAPPVRYQQISDEIKNEMDYIVNLHRDRIRDLKPSRIIRIKENGDFEVVRP
jgi:L-threonylcarbamoyladenylate synthase